jgi:clusterin-associated protein 1
MYFRELRNFCEIIRGLGYPRPISMENFKNPNFELVADILFWFSQRYDPESFIQYNIDTENDRVVFIKNIV